MFLKHTQHPARNQRVALNSPLMNLQWHTPSFPHNLEAFIPFTSPESRDYSFRFLSVLWQTTRLLRCCQSITFHSYQAMKAQQHMSHLKLLISIASLLRLILWSGLCWSHLAYFFGWSWVLRFWVIWDHDGLWVCWWHPFDSRKDDPAWLCRLECL